MASLYVQTSDRRRGASQKNFEEYALALSDKSKGFFDRAILYNYYDVFNVVRNIVPEEDLLSIPYEMLKSDPDEFVRRIVTHVEVDKNDTELLLNKLDLSDGKSAQNVPSVAENTWKLRRPSNLGVNKITLIPKVISRISGRRYDIPSRSPDWKRDSTITLTEELDDAIMTSYSESNDRLKKYISELRAFGY